MTRRNTCAADGEAPEMHAEHAPDNSLACGVPPLEGVGVAVATAVEERMHVIEEREAEMLALLRNLGATHAPIPVDAPIARPPTIPDRVRPKNVARTEVNVEDELSNVDSSSHPALPGRHPEGRQHGPLAGEADREYANVRITREGVRGMIEEEYGVRRRRVIVARRPIRQGSSLTPQVLTHPVPHDFKLSSIEVYDRTDDPLEHVNHFATIMRIYNAFYQLLCQVFPTTLKGQARSWFHSLREGEIDNFAELSQLFVDQFISNRRVVRDPSHLSGIRQKEGKNLKDFFRRFTTEAQQIPGVDHALLRGVFLGGLRPGSFYSALMRETVSSYPDLVHQVEAQIAADEAIEAHRQQFEGSSKRKRDQEPLPDLGRNNENRENPRQDRRTRQHQDYTPLNTTRTNVLLAICDSEELRRPEPLAPKRGNQSQYCEFHR